MKLILLSIYLFSKTISKGFVCSEDELIRELKEDIEDNGLLDCLRHAHSPFSDSESDYQLQARLNAQWDSDCSFESETKEGNASWIAQLKKNFNVDKLVDVNGEEVTQDFNDQADMCEIVRAILAAGKFEKVPKGPKNLQYEFLDQISCYGEDGQTKVCAATSSYFQDKKRWTILMQPVAMTFGKAPAFKKEDDS